MKNNRKYFILILVILVILLNIISLNVLILEHYQRDKIIYVFPISPKDEFSMKWIHSVELTPWEEIFRINEDYDIILDRTRFKQFGAGVPDYAGTKTEIIDGYIVFSGINQKMEYLPYGISDIAKHTFYFDNKEISLYEVVNDGDRVIIYTDEFSLIKFILYKIKISGAFSPSQSCDVPVGTSR